MSETGMQVDLPYDGDDEQPPPEKAFQDVAVIEAATMKAEGKEFTAYTIKVWPGFGFQTWTVKRRFRYTPKS